MFYFLQYYMRFNVSFMKNFKQNLKEWYNKYPCVRYSDSVAIMMLLSLGVIYPLTSPYFWGQNFFLKQTQDTVISLVNTSVCPSNW